MAPPTPGDISIATAAFWLVARADQSTLVSVPCSVWHRAWALPPLVASAISVSLVPGVMPSLSALEQTKPIASAPAATFASVTARVEAVPVLLADSATGVVVSWPVTSRSCHDCLAAAALNVTVTVPDPGELPAWAVHMLTLFWDVAIVFCLVHAPVPVNVSAQVSWVRCGLLTVAMHITNKALAVGLTEAVVMELALLADPPEVKSTGVLTATYSVPSEGLPCGRCS